MNRVIITAISDRDIWANDRNAIIGQTGTWERDDLPAVGQYVSGVFTPDNPILDSVAPISFYRVSVKVLG